MHTMPFIDLFFFLKIICAQYFQLFGIKKLQSYLDLKRHVSSTVLFQKANCSIDKSQMVALAGAAWTPTPMKQHIIWLLNTSAGSTSVCCDFCRKPSAGRPPPPACPVGAVRRHSHVFLPLIDTDTNLSSWILHYGAVSFLQIAAGSSRTHAYTPPPPSPPPPHPSNLPHLTASRPSLHLHSVTCVCLFIQSIICPQTSVRPSPRRNNLCKMKMCLNMSRCKLRVAKVLLSVWPGKPTHGDPLSPARLKKTLLIIHAKYEFFRLPPPHPPEI